MHIHVLESATNIHTERLQASVMIAAERGRTRYRIFLSSEVSSVQFIR